LTIKIKTWSKKIFIGKRIVYYVLALVFVVCVLNAQLLFTSGYVESDNETWSVICFAQYPYDYSLYQAWTMVSLFFIIRYCSLYDENGMLFIMFIILKVHLVVYSIGPFAILIVFNLLLVLSILPNQNTTLNETEQKRRKRKKLTITVICLSVYFVVLTTCGAISNILYVNLITYELGNLIIYTLNNIAFCYNAFNFLALLLSNKVYANEFKCIIFRIFGSIPVATIFTTNGQQNSRNAMTA
jgi:hypothetical protein